MTEPTQKEKATPSSKAEKVSVVPTVVKLSDIIFSDDWNREKIGNISELIQSIKARGLLAPLVVRAHPTKAGKYILKDGRRRYAALKDLGAKEANVFVDVSKEEKNATTDLRDSTIINSQRKDNTDYEKGLVYNKLVEQGAKSTEIAKDFGVKEAFVSHRLSIFKLPVKWQNEVKKENLTPTHARMFAPYFSSEDEGDTNIANQLLESIMNDKLNSSEAQERLNKYTAKKEAKAAAKDEKPKGKVAKGSKKAAADKKAGKEVEEITTEYTPAVLKEMKMITPKISQEWCQHFEERLKRTSSQVNRARIKGILEGLEISNGIRIEE